MPTADHDGVSIEYETFGSPADPAVLLVNGFTSQLTNWEVGFCEQLVAGGRFVIRYDNRDVGRSTWFDGVAPPPMKEIMAARRGQAQMPALPYTLLDMAGDGVAVLDALGIASAHVAGMSMGGMLVQVMALHFPQRVRSMTSIMSHTGEPDVGRSTPEAAAALLSVAPMDRAGYIAHNVTTRRLWSSPRHFDEVRERERLGRDYDRAFHPEGATRQYAAIMATPARGESLRALNIPTLVIHGRADTLITLSGGERTAEIIPGAALLVLNDMGHDLPEPLWPELTDAMLSLHRRAA